MGKERGRQDHLWARLLRPLSGRRPGGRGSRRRHSPRRRRLGLEQRLLAIVRQSSVIKRQKVKAKGRNDFCLHPFAFCLTQVSIPLPVAMLTAWPVRAMV